MQELYPRTEVWILIIMYKIIYIKRAFFNHYIWYILPIHIGPGRVK